MIRNLGVFIFGFGAPMSLDDEDLTCFLEDVTGRKPGVEAVNDLRRRYESIGGRSPMVDIANRQKEALQAELTGMGLQAEVYFGMKCGSPSIADVLDTAKKSGVEAGIVFTHAPQYAVIVIRAYRKAAFDAMHDRAAAMPLEFVDSYALHPGFIDAVRGRISELAEANGNMDIAGTPFIFTAHSLPEAQDLRHYRDELERCAGAISDKMGLSVHRVAFQSRGRGGGKWLGPGIEDVIVDLAKEGHESVAVCPIGFIVENLETLHDLDILAREQAGALGMSFHRVKAVNDSPELIKAWAEIVVEKLGEMV